MVKRTVTTARAILVSLISAICASAIFGGVVIFLTKPEPGMILTALVGGAVLGLPLSVPLGIVGGFCAMGVLRREVSQARSRWIGLGGVSGLTVGALGATLYCFLLNGMSPPPKEPLLIYLGIGSVAGLFAGAAVGLWCARVMRSRSVASQQSPD